MSLWPAKFAQEPKFSSWEEGTPCARRRGGGHGRRAQAEKQPSVAPAELLATVAAKTGGGRARHGADEIWKGEKARRPLRGRVGHFNWSGPLAPYRAEF